MSEPTKEHCKECGGEILHWVDIASAMEVMLELPSIPPGLVPMMRQAIDEIRKLRTQSWPTYPIVTKYEGFYLKDIYRDAMKWRQICHLLVGTP